MPTLNGYVNIAFSKKKLLINIKNVVDISKINPAMDLDDSGYAEGRSVKESW